MIKVNNIEIKQEHFPDGTLRVNDIPMMSSNGFSLIRADIVWKYENDAELFTIISLAKHYKNHNVLTRLDMYYLPHARMDRVKSDTEMFTLKHFCDTINSLNFKRVRVFDAHSNVGLALLDRVVELKPNKIIGEIIDTIKEEQGANPILLFPDDGAMKRYEQIAKSNNCMMLYGKKIRDWKTGQIKGLDICGDTDLLNPKSQVIIIDDIISFGGTMFYTIEELKSYGDNDIYVYASHAENSMLDESELDNRYAMVLRQLNDGTIKRLYTTDSLLTKQHPRVEVFELENRFKWGME